MSGSATCATSPAEAPSCITTCRWTARGRRLSCRGSGRPGQARAPPARGSAIRAARGSAGGPQPLRYDTELDAFVQSPPLDIWLPVLAEPSANLIQALRHLGLEATDAAPAPVRLSYKPRRRIVLSFGGHVLKAYAKNADFEAAASGLRSSRAVDGFRTARLEAALPTLNLTVQSWVPGRRPSDPLEAAPLAAAMLGALHDGPVNRGGAQLTVQAQATAATASADLLRTVLPHLSQRLDALVRRFAATAPDRTGAVRLPPLRERRSSPLPLPLTEPTARPNVPLLEARRAVTRRCFFLVSL